MRPVATSLRSAFAMMAILACTPGSAFAAIDVTPPIADPPGDTFNSGQHDIIDFVTAEEDASGLNLIITVTFAGPITSPTDGAAVGFGEPTTIGGYIDIDSDKIIATGLVVTHLDMFGQGQGAAFPSLGVDYYLDLNFEYLHPGFVDIIDFTTETPVQIGGVDVLAPIVYGSTSYTITVPLDALADPVTGDPDDGEVNLGVLAIRLSLPDFDATDQAPNPDGSSPSPLVPEPSSFVLFGLGLACVASRRPWRRKLAA